MEKFFIMLRDQFNYGKPLERQFQQDVIRYFDYMWGNNRNNFLMSDAEKIIFGQLSRDCQLDLYRDFLFKDYLFKFRRFFNFRFTLLQKQRDLETVQETKEKT